MSEAVTINVTDNTETITFVIVEAGEIITLTVNEAARGPVGPAGTSFPGFGTSHATASYGDHAHSGVYATTAQGALADTSIQPNVAARLTIGTGTSANTYTAVAHGQPGNLITVAHAAAATSTATTVSVTGSAITVTPGTKARYAASGGPPGCNGLVLSASGINEWRTTGTGSPVGTICTMVYGASEAWSFYHSVDGATQYAGTSTDEAETPDLIPSESWEGFAAGSLALSALASSPAQVTAAVNAHTPASALVTATGSGTGVAATQTATYLTGGSFLHAASHNEGGSDPITQLNLSGGLTTTAITFSGTGAATTRANLGAAPVAAARHVFWPAGAAIPQSATAPEASVIDSGDQDVFMDAFGFDSATSEWVQFVGYLEHWGAGTIKCKAAWTYAGAPNPATNVQWGFQARAFANDDAHNQAFGIAQVISDAPITAGDCHITDRTPAITVAGTPANGQRLQLKVYRDVANDDMAADAKLIGVWIEYTEAIAEEAAWA